jgi:predicted nucleic acid-binding protein
VRFWDTSALAALLVDEPRTARARELVDRDPEFAVWWGTPIECWSAIARLRRAGDLTADGEDAAHRRLDVLRQVWYEVLPSEEVRSQCRRLLRVHPLRAADALQLAAALVWTGRMDEGEFVVADGRLAEAARLEGFGVVRL